MSWRITLREEAAPVISTVSVPTTGAMVIRAPKGNAEPVLVAKGNEGLITRLFGYPSSTYPDVQEAIDYNNDSDIYISAPSDTTDALHGGVLVKTTGSVALTAGVADPSTFSFSATPYEYEFGVGNGVLTNFTDTLPGTYNNLSLSAIKVGSTEITVTVTDAEPEVISGAGISTGDLTRATQVIDVTLSAAPASGDSIVAVYTSDESDAYFALFSKSPQYADDQATLVTYDTANNYWKWDLYIDDFRGTAQLVDSYYGSNQAGAVDQINQPNFMDDKFEDNNYFIAVANTSVAYSSFTDDTSAVDWDGGVRSAVFTSTEYTEGWNYFQQFRNYPSEVFMDVTGDSAIPALFNTLRTSYQQYSKYLIVLPVSEDAATSITTKSGYSIDNRGLYFFSNWQLRKENYTQTSFYSSVMGATGVKYAEIVRQAFGGLAPAWLNENGLGGQLPITTQKSQYDYSETELQNLDTAGINPRVFDPSYGLLITSQKTGQNPAVLTDFSYSYASGAADYIIRNVVRQALTPQLVKLNDSNHRTKVKTIADGIVAPVAGRGILTDYLNKCDSENNTADVLNRKEFVLTTVVQYTPTSETIVYTFKSTPQGTSVEEAAI